MGKSAPEPPPPVDPNAIIKAQQGANISSFFTPVGDVLIGDVKDGQFQQGGPGLAQEITLAPESQGVFDAQTRNQLLLTNAANAAVGGLPTDRFDLTALDLPNVPGGIDFSTLTPLPDANARSAGGAGVEQATFSRLTGLLNPQFALDERRARQRLADQGLPQGGEAFETELDNLFRRRDETLLQVADQSVLAGRTEQSRLQSQALQVRTQEITERLTEIGLTRDEINQILSQALLQRGQPFNELASLTPQISPLTLPQFGQQQTADALGAFGLQAAQQNQQFQSELALQQAGLNGLFSLGSAGILGAFLK